MNYLKPEWKKTFEFKKKVFQSKTKKKFEFKKKVFQSKTKRPSEVGVVS